MNNTENFDIPVVVFFFRRSKILEIIKVISQVRPKKMYLISDGGRNDQEWEEVRACRQKVEDAIDWDCEIIKNYAEENKGVYDRIGRGATWVFSMEEKAIFLEDDNLPDVTFFDYCRELLTYYEKEEKVLWICGTNYLGKYDTPDGCSYMFTRHMLPCGWASWSHKFLKYYDGEVKLVDTITDVGKLRNTYVPKQLFKQQFEAAYAERSRIKKNTRPISWDYQMDFAVHYHELYGISPVVNQICNIGVDQFSIHGGTTKENVMTARFCEIPQYHIEFPLKHPQKIEIDPVYEMKIGKIILRPLKDRIRIVLSKIAKKFLGISKDVPLKTGLKAKFKKK